MPIGADRMSNPAPRTATDATLQVVRELGPECRIDWALPFPFRRTR
jgi:hypothetical protein